MSQPETEIRHRDVTIRGRYLLRRGELFGRDDDTVRPLLVACHGYGEDATSILEKTERIPGIERWLVCSVEALHPFYTKTGDVVRSWMTKDDREQAIRQNKEYVAGVVRDVREEDGATGALVFAGFSQGVAMAWRGAMACLEGGLEVHGLLSLAADVPPELAEEPPGGRIRADLPPVLLARGTGDEWYTREKWDRDLEVLEELGVDVTTCVFDAGHVWHEEFYAAAGRFLEKDVLQRVRQA